ncbi:MAG: MAPEG family protein [Burkholderiales bacterium]|nr:MAPEG family protein [Burkholderiales bacterium]
MTASALALFGYIGWTLLLVLAMEGMRTLLVLRGKKVASDFKPDGTDVSPFAHRLARAHANCYEHFPIIGGLLILGLATGKSSITDPLALWMLAARIAQSSVHLVSISNRALQIRFFFFAVQLVIAVWWSLRFLGIWMAT